MAKRPRSRDNIWKTEEVLQVIPKIEDLLTPNLQKIQLKYRSLSEPFCINNEILEKPTSLKPRTSQCNRRPLFFPNHLNKTFEKSKKPSSRPPTGRSKNFAVQTDGNTCKESILYARITPRIRTRKEISIPVIRLEKSLPDNRHNRTLTQNDADFFKVFPFSFPFPFSNCQERYSKTKTKKNSTTCTKIEGATIDAMNTLSSGGLSQSSLMQNFVPMFSSE
ncbi:hypothetical protein SteCoe_28393 [Stentor coeruleus]|uniref:Uncharacterized protein n=1 Tax=Stentor coeruleus TaxID=5963 RepID=A0A1R2B8D9_9CILI|nr:hypothetical protein SteCoe_28393 [Stentor coeruleus]